MTEANSKKIHDYFLGNLSQEEAASFLNEAANNQELGEQFEIEKQLFSQFSDTYHPIKVPNNEETAALKSFLESDEAKAIKEDLRKAKESFSKAPKKSNRRIWYVAASIVLLLGLTATQFFNKNQTSSELYEAYFSVSDLPNLTTRGDENALTKGVTAFSNSKYEEAIMHFEAYQQETDTFNPEIYLYLGASYQALNNLDASIEAYNKLINANALSSYKGYWFKGLALLKANDALGAKTALNALLATKNGTFKHKEAKEILDSLD